MRSDPSRFAEISVDSTGISVRRDEIFPYERYSPVRRDRFFNSADASILNIQAISQSYAKFNVCLSLRSHEKRASPLCRDLVLSNRDPGKTGWNFLIDRASPVRRGNL